jgi:2-octaprenyl-6-methoxyphenol hydroxylase
MENIVVIGAGPVGATFALLAKRQGLSVTLMEAREGPSRETRSLALSHGSRDILETANAWGDGLNATEIHAIHTSQRGGFGRSLITREDGGVPALGYVLSYANLQTALDDELDRQQITVQRGAVVTSFEEQGDHVDIRYTQGGSEAIFSAAAVVLADGGANLGKIPAISIAEKDYGQAALLGHIVTDAAHRGTAYERFTPEGPAALLPHGGEKEYSMVWVSSPARIEELKTLDEAAFLAAFQQHFGYRAGQFTHISGRRSYPLRLRTVSTRVVGNIAVIGNAAQALHPVAGQGFNLGLRDASDLARLLADAQREPVQEVGFTVALKNYGNARQGDVERSVGFTDFLVGAFSNDHLAARVPRGLALAAVDVLPFVRRALARRMLFGALK